jgi:choline dehydrogenase-like flavoprotein
MKNISSRQLSEKMDLEEYDLVVLGSGTGSKVAAWTFAEQGKRVALIELKYIGGSCHNIACLPSKNIIHSAKVASYVRPSEEFGIAIDGFRVNMSAVRERKRRMVSHSIEYSSRHFQEEWRGTHPRLRTLHRSQDLGGHTAGWKTPSSPRGQSDHQYTYARCIRTNSWSG